MPRPHGRDASALASPSRKGPKHQVYNVYHHDFSPSTYTTNVPQDPPPKSSKMAEIRRSNDIALEHLPQPATPLDNHTSPIEVASLSTEPADDDLPPTDRGLAAWRLLWSAFVFEALLWGFPLSFGVFQNYYSTHPEFGSSRYVSVIGTVASGISYMGAPISIVLLRHTMRWRRGMIWVGWLICILAILTSSYTSSLAAIILTQGVMYGVGFIIFYYPILSMVNDYWVVRRGMAYGILCSASGVAGLIMPFSLEAMLHRFGASITLRAAAGILAVTTGPLLFFLKPRQSSSSVPSATSPPPKTDWSFLRIPLFWIYSASNVLQGLGFFFPALYLPSYASSLGLSSRTGALLLALMSIAQVLGQSSFGYLSDRRQASSGSLMIMMSLVSTLISGVAMLTWGVAKSLAPLCVFAIVYGFFGTGYTALWGRMGTSVTKDSTSAFVAFGLFNFGKGLGNVLAGPVGGGLLKAKVQGGGYGVGRYEGIIVFAGSCMLASAASVGVAAVRRFKVVGMRE